MRFDKVSWIKNNLGESLKNCVLEPVAVIENCKLNGYLISPKLFDLFIEKIPKKDRELLCAKYKIADFSKAVESVGDMKITRSEAVKIRNHLNNVLGGKEEHEVLAAMKINRSQAVEIRDYLNSVLEEKE